MSAATDESATKGETTAETTADTATDTSTDTSADTSTDTATHSPTDPSDAAWEQEYVHPLDESRVEPAPPTATEPDATRRRRGLGANRHLGSVVLSFLGVLGAYAAVDYAYYRTLGPGLTAYQGGAVSDGVMIAAAVAAGCMFVAAAAGRISALGPLLAGLVLGVGPCVWIVLDRQSYVDRANDVPELWSHTSFGLVGAGAVLYPVVAGLLIGTAIAGRWRRLPVTT